MTKQLVVNGPGEAWASAVDGHLRWIHNLLGSLRLPAERRDMLRSRLRAVQARAADPELRVAVFGEASSGKSTLLNAFLRRRLLPSSALVTTRTTTVLRYRDGAEGLRVRTPDGVVLTWPSTAFAHWAGERYESGPTGLEYALERVLTTQLSEQIRGLEVLSPVRLLGDGTTVLDTPGFSVSDSGHRELAVAAARQADLALVVVPAVAAMSMTLVDFLTGPLGDHHDRCAFVLTKVDLLDDDERSEVVEVVGNRLKELGISDPVLLPCAPGEALKEITKPGARRPGASEYLPRFRAIEARIARLATERRQSAIAATVLGLLSQLLSAVAESAETQRAALSRTERGLAALSLPDFPAFLNAWAQRTLDGAGNELNHAAFTSIPVASRAELDTKVVAAVAGDKINKMVEATGNVSRIVRLHLRREAERAVRASADRAGELLTSGAEELARDFATQYSALAVLVGEVWAPPAAATVAATDLPAPDLSGLDHTLTEIGARLTASDNWRTGGGAMAGALAGSLIAPGIGTVIGGALGAFIGKRSPDAARAQFLERARPIIAAAYDEVGTLISESLPRVRGGVSDSVAALCAQYEDEWGDEIARLAAANDRQRAELAAGIAAAEEAATAARHRRERVAALRSETTATRTVPDLEEQ
ncbi:dynamin family protein [Streptomyces sp. ISL-1]|uniref:dynamin family protein n=1 Tax=Streptomyces sp. ISL-1 TaxID=2817657 RepID=UPI001BE8DF06|nr:dynamin family protein [Streptomyces sp. ISL-1]MBT2389156.1 dynamin family protein [Streptomyces sp. ISL-1]